MLLPTTLCMAAAAAVLNVWLSMRISKVRHAEKVSVGDGGSDLLLRRMRAQANFIENTPISLILVAAVELTGKGGVWLAPVAAVFILGRVAHAFGMDETLKGGRTIGAASAMLIQLGLAVVAVLAATGIF